MTNEEVLTILEKSEQCHTENCPDGVFCDECPWNVKTDEYDEAIKTIKSVLSKQCASTEQADHIAEPDKMIKLEKRTITERLIIAESLINSVIADSDQFREDTKMTDDVLINLPSAQPETNCSEIPNDLDTISRQMAIDIVEFECGEWSGLAKTIVNGLKKLSPKQSEKMPYKKPEIIRCKDCKYSVDEYSEGDCYCRRPKKGIDYIGNWNFYCADAERRNDG